ncbi:capsid protein [Mesorhizobium sp.]|uniref:capsid protein n=1 Tax=Mesorhizobium sp. TaxID=1871066 RepID=UPI000FE855A4|nr:capsid protein [Mesorhizobium sp.]RWC58914.1 MAG: capsid protein [Mesorhizobium sp.]RWC66526.1 MAG: capsid protein [Mesorhizobium sp.]
MAPNRPFVVDAVLTAIAIGYSNPTSALIADRVLPRQQVGAEKFKWTEYPLSEAFNIPDARVGRRGRVQQLEFGGTENTSEVEDFGLESPIPYSDIDAARVAREEKRSTFDPEGHATMMLTDTIANIREVRTAGIIHNLNTYDAARRVTLAGNSQFSDYANSDPIGVLKTAFEGTLVFPPNTMSMGRQVWSKLSSHPKIVNAVKGNVTDAGIITRSQFIELFSEYGLRELLVGDAWYNTAKPGQAVNLGRAWGKHIALTYNNPIATPEGGGITFGFTAQYGSKISGRIDNPYVGLQGGVDIRTGERVKELVVAKDTGYFIQNAVA